MQLEEIVPGLWRWTAPHPEWVAGDDDPDSPDGWARDVGCVLFAGEAATVLIDPLLADGDGAWAPLDRVVEERGRLVVVLTTIEFHERSRNAALERYSGVDGRHSAPPAGVEALSIPDAGETFFWLPGPRALVPGDRLLGTPDGGIRQSPESWTGYMPRPLASAELRALLLPLLDLPVERILLSHGAPVLRDGRAALAAALGDG